MTALRAPLVALGFLTRLPIGRSWALQPAELGHALAFFPFVGLLIGALLVALERVLRGHLSTELVAVALTAVLVALTGGLHLDGVADVFDGVAGGRGDRARTLEIMRDSRIGSLGAAALVLVIVAKLFALRELLQADPSRALCLAPLIARACAVPLVVFFPYARSSGLGAAFHGHGRPAHVVCALGFAGAALLLGDGRTLLAAAAAVGTAFALALWLHGKLGGLTGDAYGAAIELSELAFLLGMTVRA